MWLCEETEEPVRCQDKDDRLKHGDLPGDPGVTRSWVVRVTWTRQMAHQTEDIVCSYIDRMVDQVYQELFTAFFPA